MCERTTMIASYYSWYKLSLLVNIDWWTFWGVGIRMYWKMNSDAVGIQNLEYEDLTLPYQVEEKESMATRTRPVTLGDSLYQFDSGDGEWKRRQY